MPDNNSVEKEVAAAEIVTKANIKNVTRENAAKENINSIKSIESHNFIDRRKFLNRLALVAGVFLVQTHTPLFAKAHKAKSGDKSDGADKAKNSNPFDEQRFQKFMGLSKKLTATENLDPAHGKRYFEYLLSKRSETNSKEILKCWYFGTVNNDSKKSKAKKSHHTSKQKLLVTYAGSLTWKALSYTKPVGICSSFGKW